MNQNKVNFVGGFKIRTNGKRRDGDILPARRFHFYTLCPMR
jgi:hypothetical protein